MKASAICGAAMLISMLAPAVLAQSPVDRSGGGSTEIVVPGSGSDPAALRSLVGRDVENVAGDAIGEVDDVVMLEGRRTLLVISVGGFLGLGEKLVTIPFEDVTMTSEGLMVNMTADQLKRQPAYDPKAQIGTSLKGSARK